MKKSQTLLLALLLLSGCQVAPYCAQAPQSQRVEYNVTSPEAPGYAPAYPSFDTSGPYLGKLPVVKDEPHWTPGD